MNYGIIRPPVRPFIRLAPCERCKPILIHIKSSLLEISWYADVQRCCHLVSWGSPWDKRYGPPHHGHCNH